jgi:hypothetical protein
MVRLQAVLFPDLQQQLHLLLQGLNLLHQRFAKRAPQLSPNVA